MSKGARVATRTIALHLEVTTQTRLVFGALCSEHVVTSSIALLHELIKASHELQYCIHDLLEHVPRGHYMGICTHAHTRGHYMGICTHAHTTCCHVSTDYSLTVSNKHHVTALYTIQQVKNCSDIKYTKYTLICLKNIKSKKPVNIVLLSLLVLLQINQNGYTA